MKERCRHYPDPYQISSLIDQRCPRKAFSLVRRSELRQLRHQETGAAIVQLEHAVRRIRRPIVQALLPSAAGRAGIIEAGRQRLRGQRGLCRIQRKAGARAVLRWKSRRAQARRPAAPGACTRSAMSREEAATPLAIHDPAAPTSVFFHARHASMDQVVNPLALARALTEFWSPRVVAELDDSYVKVAKVHGELPWHAHANEDELFFVLSGCLRIRMHAFTVELGPGEAYVVPKGVLHQPQADAECCLMLIERKSTAHTGDTVTPYTRSLDEQLRPIEASSPGP